MSADINRPILAQEVMVRLGREGKVATWGWCELVTHPSASRLRDQYVSAVALGIAMRLGPEGRDAYPSLRILSRRLSISRKICSRSAWALEAGGWLDDIGHGPRGTIRWNATVPVALYRVMENAHFGDGLPWVELLDDDRVCDAVTVAAYIAAAKDDRQATGDTAGSTDPPVGHTGGSTDADPPDPNPPEAPVEDATGSTPRPASEAVGDTGGTVVGDTTGSRTSRDPTNRSNQRTTTHAHTRCKACGSTTHRWGCDTERTAS